MFTKYLLYILILFLLGYLISKNFSRKGSFERFSKEEQKKIIREIKEKETEAFKEARKKHPIGEALVGETINLDKEIVVKLDNESSQVENSYKVQAKKIPAGTDIEVLDVDLDSGEYIIRTENIRKAWAELDELFNKRIHKQQELQMKLSEKYLERVAEEYNLSKDELSKFRDKVNRSNLY